MQDKELIRVEKYRTAPAAIRDLYSSPVLGELLRSQFKLTLLPLEKYRSFVDIFGDVILEIEKKETMESKLIGYFNISDALASSIVVNVSRSIYEANSSQVQPRDVEDIKIRPDDFKPPQREAGIVPPPTASATLTVRVMPHSPEEAAASQVRSGTQLPNSLLKNLHASLAHSAPEDPAESDVTTKPSYNTFLGKKPPLN